MNKKLLLPLSFLLATALAPVGLHAQQLPPGMVFKFDRDPQPITFTNGNIKLSGVLVEPEGKGPFPALVLVHGSGPGTHDEIAFIVHGNAFLKGGFAVLAYDKRGSGNSSGALEISDYNDLASDVAGAVAFLRTRPEIAPTKIGLLGRSEGGWVSVLAASREPKIAFVIMSSGCAASPLEETLYETRQALQQSGVSPDLVEQAAKFKTALWEFDRRVVEGRTSAETLRAQRAQLLKQLDDFHKVKMEGFPPVMDPEADDRRKFAAIANMIYYDPQPALNSLRAPLLEAIGTDDEAVDPATTLAALDRLRSSGHDITIKTFPGVGHSLLKVQGGTILGYADGYLEQIVTWAHDRVQ